MASDGYLATLRNRDYRLIWAGQVTSTFGDALYEIALVWLVLGLTGSDYGVVGIVLFVRLVAGLISGPVAGVYADRLNRRQLMIVCDSARALVLIALPLLHLVGTLAVWHVCLVAGLLTIFRTFFNPALQASIPQVVTEQQILPANAVLHASTQAAMIAGPALAGLALAVTTPHVLLAADALTFVVSAACLAFARIRPLERGAERSSVFSELGSTVRYVYQLRPVFWSLVLFAAGLLAVAGTLRVGIPALAETVLSGGAATFGLLMSAMGIGTVVGALVVGRLKIQRYTVWMFGGWVAWGGFFAVLGLSGHLWLAVAVAALAGAAEAVTDVSITALLQKSVSPDRLGKVFSMWSLLAATGDSASALIIGQSLKRFQTVAVFVVSGLAAAAVGIFGWFVTRNQPVAEEEADGDRLATGQPRS